MSYLTDGIFLYQPKQTQVNSYSNGGIAGKRNPASLKKIIITESNNCFLGSLHSRVFCFVLFFNVAGYTAQQVCVAACAKWCIHVTC